jgi:ribosome maturation factor RimP
MPDNSTIVAAVTPVLAARGLELYDVEIAGSGRAAVLRLLVTAPPGRGALDLDAIAHAAEALSPVLDAPEIAGRLPSPYALEVSSPGLERPLRTADHYRGAIGEVVSIKVQGAERTRARLVAADGTGFQIESGEGTRRIAYDDVVQARTVFEWGDAHPESGHGTSAKEVARR